MQHTTRNMQHATGKTQHATGNMQDGSDGRRQLDSDPAAFAHGFGRLGSPHMTAAGWKYAEASGTPTPATVL
jgi:hypothetical protein